MQIKAKRVNVQYFQSMYFCRKLKKSHDLGDNQISNKQNLTRIQVPRIFRKFVHQPLDLALRFQIGTDILQTCRVRKEPC